MRSASRALFVIIFITLVVLLGLLSACGSKVSQPQEDQTSLEEIQANTQPEAGDDASDGFEEVPVPEGFPASFPIPDGARLGYSGKEPAEGSFQILVKSAGSLDETLDFYRQSLPANGWTLIDEQAVENGHGMTISNPEYEGELYFIFYEEESYVDVSLDPLGAKPEFSDVSENLGSSTALGDSGTDFPADFPLPVGAEQIPLPDKLAGEGYQLAFAFPDMPELAYIQFSAAIVGSGWIIGDFQMGTNSYTMPFSNPSTGFEGYALLTSNPQTAGVSSITGCVVALHPGK